MRQGSWQSRSQLKLTFRSRVMWKNVFLDLWMTSDNMTILFENVPLDDSHIVPKHETHRTPLLEVIALLSFQVFLQYLTSSDLDGQQKQ